MTRCFIDSNIVVYANDTNSGAKQGRAIDTITACMESGIGYISVQVLQEYANVALKKLGQDPPIVIRQLKLLEAMKITIPSPRSVRRSVEISHTYQVSFWDASIIAAAEDADCEIIFTENLNTGHYYSGIEVLNPLDSSCNALQYIKR